jgi:hypothetical protein
MKNVRASIISIGRSLSAELRQEKSRLSVCEERVVSADAAVRSTQWAVEAQKDIGVVRTAEDAVALTAASVRYLAAKAAALREVVAQRAQARKLLRDSEKLLAAASAVGERGVRCAALRRLTTDLRDTAASRESTPTSKWVDAVVAASDAVESRKTRILALQAAVAMLCVPRKSLPAKAVDRILTTSQSVYDRGLRVQGLQKLVQDMRQTAGLRRMSQTVIADLEASTPETCPACGQVVVL